jgi:hypothetical protein
MTLSLAHRTCDAEGCDRPAAFEVWAQWSEADFGSWFACQEHHNDVVEWLISRTVDGRPVVDVQSYTLNTT